MGDYGICGTLDISLHFISGCRCRFVISLSLFRSFCSRSLKHFIQIKLCFPSFNILSTNRERSSDAEPTPSGLSVGGIRGQWFWIETQPTVSMWVKCNLNPTQFAGLTLNNRSSSSNSSSTGPGSTLTGPGCQNPLKFNLNPFSSASGNLQQHSLLFKIPLGSEVFSELLKKWLKRWKVTKNQMNRTECESRRREEMLLQFMLSLLMTT